MARPKYPAKFKKLSNPDLPLQEKLDLTREFATKYTSAFNKQLDKIDPDPYRGTRKLANMLIQEYPDRFPDKNADHVVDMMKKIAKVESKNRNIRQNKGGPGRGYFQIETTTAPVAKNRYVNYVGREKGLLNKYTSVPLPEFEPTPGPEVWSEKLGKMVPTANVMNLSKDKQAMMALSNISTNAKLDKGEVDPDKAMETWIKYHWAGPAADKAERMAHWEDTFKAIQANPQPTTQKHGGRLKRKAYGPRPEYMNTMPAHMMSGPSMQRSVGNTGSQMEFGNGGWLYPTNTAFPEHRKGGYILPGHTYPTYADGGVTFSSGGEKHRVYIKESPTGLGKGVEGHVMVNHPTMDKGKWDTIDLTEKAGAKTVAQGVAATKKWHRENPEYAKGGWTGYPDHTMYSAGMERFDRVRKYTKYKKGGPVTWDLID